MRVSHRITMNRNKKGRFARYSRRGLVFGIVFLGACMIFFHVPFMHWMNEQMAQNAELSASNVLPIAKADVDPSISVEELENRLDAIVWGGESEKKVMAEGEIFPTFDPSKAMYAQCIKIGGTQPKDCLSYGPRQEKIGTIEVYWPKLHSGETVSDKRAREIAEDNVLSRRFFLDCAEYAKGCADNWTTFTAHKPEGQIYLDLIRQAKGITL